MSAKLTYEQKRAILLTLKSVPVHLRPYVGSVRITESGKIQVLAKPGVVLPGQSSERDFIDRLEVQGGQLVLRDASAPAQGGGGEGPGKGSSSQKTRRNAENKPPSVSELKERENRERKGVVVFVAREDGTVEKGGRMDKNQNGLDDAWEGNMKAGTLAQSHIPGFVFLKVKALGDLRAKLLVLQAEGFWVKVMVIASHGDRTAGGFTCGLSPINPQNQSSLKVLSEFLRSDSYVVIKACNVGYPKFGEYVQKMSNTLGCTVFASESWSAGSSDVFNVKYALGKSKVLVPASAYPSVETVVKRYPSETLAQLEERVSRMGAWVGASPGGTGSQLVGIVYLLPAKPWILLKPFSGENN